MMALAESHRLWHEYAAVCAMCLVCPDINEDASATSCCVDMSRYHAPLAAPERMSLDGTTPTALKPHSHKQRPAKVGKARQRRPIAKIKTLLEINSFEAMLREYSQHMHDLPQQLTRVSPWVGSGGLGAGCSSSDT